MGDLPSGELEGIFVHIFNFNSHTDYSGFSSVHVGCRNVDAVALVLFVIQRLYVERQGARGHFRDNFKGSIHET